MLTVMRVTQSQGGTRFVKYICTTQTMRARLPPGAPSPQFVLVVNSGDLYKHLLFELFLAEICKLGQTCNARNEGQKIGRHAWRQACGWLGGWVGGGSVGTAAGYAKQAMRSMRLNQLAA